MRLTLPSSVLAAVVVIAAGCGSSADGVSDAKLIAALDLTTVDGHYAIGKNPFCSIAKLLHNSEEVSDAASSRRVFASEDETVGIEVITPFSPKCGKEAQKALDKLARKT